MDSLNKEILRLSIPTIISNVTVPLLGICDTAIAGHLESELFLSAIAVGSVMLNVVFWIFGFLRGGTTGITANELGAGSQSGIARVLYRSLIISGIAGILLIIFSIPIFKGLWAITGSGPDIKESVEYYFKIRIWGSPALLAGMAISGWFVGMQNTFYPMVIAISMNVINIAASCILVYPCHFGFIGIAVGTLISNWAGLLISVICMAIFLKGKFLRIRIDSLFHGEWIRYFSVNGNLFLRSLFIICVTMGVTAAGARIDYLSLAVNVVVMQLFQFFSFFMDGFAYSGEALVGLRCGEKNLMMLKKSVKRLLKFTLVTALVFSFIYLFGSGLFASLLTDKENVIENVENLRLLVALIPIISCWAFIYDGFYIGITDTKRMMISTLAGALAFFAIISINFTAGLSLSTSNKNSIIWIAFISYLGLRGLYLWAKWRNTLNHKFSSSSLA